MRKARNDIAPNKVHKADAQQRQAGMRKKQWGWGPQGEVMA
jgi:hypothetical protein